MKFIISRSSDYFRDCILPSKEVKPHPKASWDDALRDWIIECDLKDILEICGTSDRIIIGIKDRPYLEIDDLS